MIEIIVQPLLSTVLATIILRTKDVMVVSKDKVMVFYETARAWINQLPISI